MKINKAAAVLAGALLLYSVPAYAADISIETFNAPTNVMDSENAGFSVKIYTTSFVNNDYTIEYTVGDISQTEEVRANAYLEEEVNINLEGLLNGVYDLSVTIRDENNDVVSTLDTVVGITDYYQSRPMEEYSKTSMTTHMSFSAQTDAYEVGLMPKIGILKNRDEIFWSMVEPARGYWTFERSDEYMALLAENGLETLVIMDYSNQNHVITDVNGDPAGDKTAPRTAEEMSAFCEYVKNTLTRYPQIKSIEVWNEPNWSFWAPEPDAVDYAAMVKAVSSAAREVRPDIYVVAGALVFVDHEEFLQEIIDEGILDYADCISTHPYSFPYGSDNVLDGKLESINTIISENGGFKDHMVSEIGLPTSTGERGTSQAEQASEMIKIFAYNEDNRISLTNWYNFRNKGSNPSEEEDNYGILNRDYTPKQALIALANYNNLMNGSIYFGSAAIDENTELYIYLKDASAVAIAWNKAGETVSAEGICASAADIFGNETDPEIGEVPVYLFDIDPEYLYAALREELLPLYEGMQNNPFAQEQTANLNAEDMSAQEIKGIITGHAGEGLRLISESYAKDPDGVMNTLDILSRASEKWAALYAYLHGEKIEYAIDVSVEDKAKKPDTASVLEYAKKNDEKCSAAENSGDFPGKDAAVGYYSALGFVYSSWANALDGLESEREYSDVFLYPEKTNYEISRGETETLNITAINNEDKEVEARVFVCDQDGTRVSEPAEVSIPAGEQREFSIELSIPAYEKAGEKKYTLYVISDGGEISKRSIRADIKSDITEYSCFDALDFEDPQQLETVDAYGSVSYISGGVGVDAPHSGNGAVYVNGSGDIRISAEANPSGSAPQDGDFIDGEYYLKVMEEVPTDWRQPIIRLYGVRGTERTLLAEPKDLNSYSVWETERFAWNRLELESTGVPYDSDMELVCEITVGIGTNGGLKFMLDDISYYTSLNENDDGLEKAYGIPKINSYADFNGGFEITADGGFPNGWRQYVPNQDVDMGGDAFVPSSENVWEGETSLRVDRGGSMWNILYDVQEMTGDFVGGSYMLYVPEGAELSHNYPRVWVEYVVDGITYTAASSPANVSEYPVETGWNKIPIIPEGVSIARNAERVNFMVEAPNIIDEGIVNRPYNASYYIDDIQIGELLPEVYISENSSAGLSGGSVCADVVVSNASTNDRVGGNLTAAVYDGGRLVSCTSEAVSVRGRGPDMMNSVTYRLDCGAADGENLSVKLFLFEKDMITPLCESLSLDIG